MKHEKIHYGKDSNNWKGSNLTYTGFHNWVNRKFPRIGVCEHCLEKKKTEYAKIHGRKYSRSRRDYLELCSKCHRKYDGQSERMKIIWKNISTRKKMVNSIIKGWITRKQKQLQN